MSYSSDSFLKPIGSDKNIKFYDNSGTLTYTIKPTFITDVIDDINLLKVILKSGKEIKLDFLNTGDVVLTKSILLEQISILLNSNDYVDNSQTTIGYSTATYSYDTFLRPIADNDRNIKILGIDLLVKYTINPFTISNTNVSGNLIRINQKSNRIIVLEFSTSNEAKIALIRLREQIDLLINKTPLLIDKDIQNYVTNVVDTLTTNGTFSSIATSNLNLLPITIPLNPTGGAMYYDGTHSYIYTNNDWVQLDNPATFSSLITNTIDLQTTDIPLNPTTGTIYFNGTHSYIYTNNDWVQLDNPATFSSLITNTIDLQTTNVPLNPTTGTIYYDGIHSYIYTNNEWMQLDNTPKDPNTIYVRKIGGDFTSIKEAVDSITNSSFENRYLIIVGPGQYIEETIDFTGKPYISIEGSDIQTTQVIPNTGMQHLFITIDTIQLSFLTISDVGVGYAAIVCEDLNGFVLVHKLSMYDCDTMVLVRGITQSTTFFGEYIDFNGTYTYGIKVESENGTLAFASCENYFNLPTSPGSYGNWITGDNASISVLGGSSTGVGDDTAFYAQDGATLTITSFNITNYTKGIEIGEDGIGSKFEANAVSITGCECNLYINHTGAFGTFQGSSTHTKTYNISPNIFWSYLDNFDGEFEVTRKISVAYSDGTHTDLSTLLFEGSGMGLLSGGIISKTTGLTVSISEGYGYLEAYTGNIIRIDWPDSLYQVEDNSSKYIYINENFLETNLFYEATSLPVITNTIVLGRVITNNGEVVLIDTSYIEAEHISNKLTMFNRKALGSIYERGSLVTEGATFSLDVSRGSYYFGSRNYMPYGGLGITFSQFILDGTNWTINDTNTITNQYVSNGQLVGMSASYYTKHTLYVNGEGDTEKYLLVVGQEQYNSQNSVEVAALPTTPSYFEDAIVPIASIVIKEGHSTIFEILDIRPVIGFKSTGVNATSLHGNLLGLQADDHPQYLLVNGNRAMQDILSMGNNSIINVLDVNGVVVESHAERHLPTSGLDPLTTGTPSTIETTNKIGIRNAFARQDHIHAHGDQPGGTLHATASYTSAGFMSMQDKISFDNLKITYIPNTGNSSQLIAGNGSPISAGPGINIGGGFISLLSVTGPAGATGIQGPTGATGINGTSGINGNISGLSYLIGNFSTATASGTNSISFNNTAAILSTLLYITPNDFTGANVSNFLSQMGTSTNPTHKGNLILSKYGDSNTYIIYNVSAVTNVTPSTTYYRVSVTYVVGNGTFSSSDRVVLSFSRTGNIGATGSNGTNGVNGINGVNGSNGAQGPAGPQGPQGPEGPQGPAGSGSGTSTDYQYIQGSLELGVESTLVELSGLVTYNDLIKYKKYNLKGRATFKNSGSSYALLVGVISLLGEAPKEIINSANSSTIATKGVNTFVNTTTPFTINGLVKDFTTGDIIPLTKAFFILDNSIARESDYFITLFAQSTQIFSGYVEIDLEILISDRLIVTYSN